MRWLFVGCRVPINYIVVASAACRREFSGLEIMPRRMFARPLIDRGGSMSTRSGIEEDGCKRRVDCFVPAGSPEGGGTCAHTAENNWRVSETPDCNVDNNSNHSYILIRFSLLLDDRPSPRSFAWFRSSPFGFFSLLGRCRNQFTISGNPCHSLQSGPNDRRFRSANHCFDRSGGGFA